MASCVQRHLAAILAADVVGYSRLMGIDELGTLLRLKTVRKKIINPLISDHYGRIVKEMGDGILVEFGSVVEAVRCAIGIQNALSIEPNDDSEKVPIQFRIGINLGDVILDNDDLFGDGINVAARLEGIAEPGGICIASSVYDQVKSRVDAKFEDIGEQRLKNIIETVQVYRLSLGDSTASGPALAAGPNKPSLAVLPIENISASPDLDAFADGLSEDLVAALAEYSEISVASRSASHPFAGIDAREAARQLGVGNILEGRVQGSANRMRVTLQLVDGTSGDLVWGERNDSEIDDMFALQDEIVRKVISGIRTTLIDGDLARIVGRSTQNLTAWLRCSEAFGEWAKFSIDGNFRARELFRLTLEADPAWSRPLVGLAATYRESAIRGWGSSRERDLEEATSLAELAIDISPVDQAAYAILGQVQIDKGQVDEGIALCEKAVEIAPSDFASLAALAWSLPMRGEIKRSLATFARSHKVRPIPSGACLANNAFVLHLDGQHDRAIELLEQSFERTDIIDSHIRLAAVYADTERLEDARAKISDVISQQPDATVEEYTGNLPFPDKQKSQWYVELLRSTGLPHRS